MLICKKNFTEIGFTKINELSDLKTTNSDRNLRYVSFNTDNMYKYDKILTIIALSYNWPAIYLTLKIGIYLELHFKII